MPRGPESMETDPLAGQRPYSFSHYLQQHWRGDLLALGVLLAAALLFFAPVVLGQAWIPRGGGDSVSFLYPMYRFAAESLHSGDVPLWNPYQYAGAPFITDNQAGIFYPFNLLLFLVNPTFSYRAIEALVIFHFFFAGAGMYVCLRGIRPAAILARPAAVVGSLAFMFSGVFIAHIGNLNLIAVAAWLPLVFLAFHFASLAQSRERGAAFAVLAGVLLGLATLAGHGQMTFLIATYMGAYALFRAACGRSWWPLLALLILAATAVGLAAINLFPSLQSVQYTVRAEFNAQRALDYALPWRGLLGLAAPGFYGRGEVAFWGDWQRVEYGYAGVLTLFLAGVALILDRARLTLFLALSALLFTILALGDNTPLYPFLLRVLPVFPFQVPARFVLLLDFSLAILAALGADALMREPRTLRLYLAITAVMSGGIATLLLWIYLGSAADVPQHQRQMLVAIGLFLLFAAGSWSLIRERSYGRLAAQSFGLLAVLLLAADLISQGWNIELDRNDPLLGFPTDSPALQYIKENAGLQRIEIVSGAWQPNLPQLEKLYAIDGVYNPLELANYAVYIGSIGYRGSPMYNLLGTKYLIGGKNDPPGDTSFLVPVFDQDPQVTVFLNTLALPRAMVLHNATVVAGHDAAFVAVHLDGFDPQRMLILEEGESLLQEPGESKITVLRYDPNFVSFEVTTDKPGYFLLSDIYHPQWKATIDGQQAPILVGDYALRAVALEPGTHLVEMRFAPPAWRWGVIVTILTAVILPILLLWLHRKQDRESMSSEGAA